MRRTAIAICGVLMSLPVWTQARDITVHVQTHANISKIHYTLGDVAKIVGDEDLTALAGLILGIAPRMGHAQVVQRTDIARLIERNRPELRDRIRWAGAQAVTVRGEGSRYDGRRLQAAAMAYLQARLAPDFARIELTPVGRLDDLVHPFGALSITPRLCQVALSKRMCVWLDVRIDGRPYRSLPVWVAVQAYNPVWVVKRALEAQQVVNPEDVMQEVREIAGITDALPTNRRWDAWRLRRPVAVGEVLRERDLQRVPAVSRAQDVRVRVAAGAVAVETQGTALADGRIGDRVKIVSPKNQMTYFGRVVEQGVVLVEGK